MAAVASVFGNTPEPHARANHRALAALCGYRGPLLAGATGPLGTGPAPPSEATGFLLSAPGPWRFLALGPLTNLAAAIVAAPAVVPRVAEVISVGSNRRSRGRWPPWWPHEFNLTLDRRATRVVFESGVPLTVIPLDVARRLTVRPADLAPLRGRVGEHLRRHSARWFRRAVFLRGRREFPVWDLVAALFVVEPALFTVETATACLHPSGLLQHGAGTRPLTVVTGFDRDLVWARFVALASAVDGGPTRGGP